MTQPTVSIVVPVFNEERRLPSALERLESDADRAAAAAKLELKEVVVVDDGSTDRTPAILNAFAGLPGRFRFLRFERDNRGKGAAVRAGMLAVDADVALMTDVDLSTPLDDLALLAAALDDGADVAIGSRGLPDSQVLVHQPRHRELMGKTFNVLVRLLTRLPWRDTQCGFKLFRVETTRMLFELQTVDGFAFDVELLVIARQLGLNVSEIPVRWVNDPDTQVGLVSSPTAMALDVIRIAYRGRRPLR